MPKKINKHPVAYFWILPRLLTQLTTTSCLINYTTMASEDRYRFASYLTNQQQCVQIGEHISEFETVKHGVPQGSILGPLLFL